MVQYFYKKLLCHEIFLFQQAHSWNRVIVISFSATKHIFERPDLAFSVLQRCIATPAVDPRETDQFQLRLHTALMPAIPFKVIRELAGLVFVERSENVRI